MEAGREHGVAGAKDVAMAASAQRITLAGSAVAHPK